MFDFFKRDKYDKNDECIKIGITRGHFRIDENDKVVITERGEGFKEALEEITELFGGRESFIKASVRAVAETTLKEKFGVE